MKLSFHSLILFKEAKEMSSAYGLDPLAARMYSLVFTL